jgi:DNA invertase Pin-like site-specific DNA recombinase
VFADSGESGGKANRPEFQRMLVACRAGEIDIVLTKSISRFARDIVHLLQVTRELKAIGVGVRFEKEDIDTLTEDGEIKLALLGTFAEQERKTLSENIKWSFIRRFNKGLVNSKNIYGYKYTGDICEVVPEQAAVVQRIFADYISGVSVREIERRLESEGIRPYKGERFYLSTLCKMLKNERYTGTLTLQKTYRDNGKKVINTGELDMFTVDNAHPAIIDCETFAAAQAERVRRDKAKIESLPSLSGKIICGKCGAVHRRQQGSRGRHYWTCSPKRSKRFCDKKNIIESALLDVAVDDFVQIISHDNNKLLFVMADGSEISRIWSKPKYGS